MTRPESPRERAAASDVRVTRAADRVEDEQVLELREEELVAHKELRAAGEIVVRTEVEQVPGRLEVDAFHEEVEIQHEPVGQMVSERQQPWEEDGALIVPVYEEQLVVSKRLVLKERLRIRRIGTRERRLFEDTLRRERLVVEDPQHTGLVHEMYPTEQVASETSLSERAEEGEEKEKHSESGFLQNIVLKALE